MSELAKALRRLRDERFDGNLTETAKALGINHGYLSQAISGRVGCGKKLCLAYARLTGESLNDVLVAADEPRADPPDVAKPAPTRADFADLFATYDAAGATALKLRDMTLVVSGGDPLDRQVDQSATTQVVNMLDELRRLIRERIETEASGKAVSR